jgi:type IV secretory pathway VirB6-like protein
VGTSRFVLTVFVILQIADGLITFGAVRVFGPVAEGNPVLQTWIQLLGPGVTLLAAKSLACAGASLLYFAGRQRTLIVLTTLLAFFGVGPWLALLGELS